MNLSEAYFAIRKARAIFSWEAEETFFKHLLFYKSDSTLSTQQIREEGRVTLSIHHMQGSGDLFLS